MKKKSRFLQTPIEPFVVEPGLTAEELLSRMERISFQGRNLATAHRIWQKMLTDDVTIFLGMAGALSAGGLRLVVADLIATRKVDCWSRPAPTCITICTKPAAATTMSGQHTPTMPHWRRTGSIVSTTPSPAKRNSSTTT